MTLLHFKVSKVELNGSLTTLDRLNHDELDQWMNCHYGKYATIRVEANNGRAVIYTDNGTQWEKVPAAICV